jgi:hypothetical protein
MNGILWYKIDTRKPLNCGPKILYDSMALKIYVTLKAIFCITQKIEMTAVGICVLLSV